MSVALLLQVIKVYNEDNSSRALEVPSDITARDVCQLFVLKNQCVDDHNWTLFEHLPHLGIGKTFVTVATCISFCFSQFMFNLSSLYMNGSSLVLVSPRLVSLDLDIQSDDKRSVLSAIEMVQSRCHAQNGWRCI